MGPHQVPDGALQGKPGTVPLALGPALVSPRGWRPMRTTEQGREADMRCPLPHADLHAWFDGALEPSQTRRVQHHQFRRHALAMQRRTVGPQKIPATGYTVQLPPWTATRMAIRANIASADPAIMPRGRLRAELVRSGHLPRTATRGGHQRWQGSGRLMAVRFGVLTGGTEGLVRQSGEGFPRL
jgi:hypothetical protein